MHFSIFEVGDEVAYADQPEFADLKAARKHGFRTLVNVRLQEEQLTDAAQQATRAGLAFARIPVGQHDWNREHFERFAAVMRTAVGPVLVHCSTGRRAGVLALTWYAARHGWSWAELSARSRSLGLDLPHEAHEYLATVGGGAHAAL